jgi:hypothetical protein
MRLKSPTRDMMLVTLANGEAGSGYVPTGAAFSTSAFQVLGTGLKPGCAETSLVNGMTEFIAEPVLVMWRQ